MAPLDDDTETATPAPSDAAPPAAPLARASRPTPLGGPRGIWAAFNALYTRYAPFVRRFLGRRRDLLPESVKDLIQKVWTTVSFEVVKREKRGEPIRNPEALIVTIVGHEVSNHKRLRRPPIVVETLEIASTERDPEGMAEIYERQGKLLEHFKAMKQDEVELIVCVDVYELTYAETALALRRPLSTVAKQYQRARAILDARIRAAGESAAPSEPLSTPRR